MKRDPILSAAAAAFVAIAVFAGIVSYGHLYAVGIAHGQDQLASRLTPLSIDVLILAASLAVLWAVSHKVPPPWPLRGVLVAGVAATIAGNVLYGWAHGLIGAVYSSWPGAAFVAAVEVLMWLVKARKRLVPVSAGATAMDALAAAQAAYAQTALAGNPLSQNQLQERFSLTRAQARQVAGTAPQNGSGHA